MTEQLNNTSLSGKGWCPQVTENPVVLDVGVRIHAFCPHSPHLISQSHRQRSSTASPAQAAHFADERARVGEVDLAVCGHTGSYSRCQIPARPAASQANALQEEEGRVPLTSQNTDGECRPTRS